MIRIVSAREQYEAMQPWIRMAADGVDGDQFGDPTGFVTMPDATGGMTGGQTGVDMNNDGLIDVQTHQFDAEESKWDAQKSMYDMQTQGLKNQAPPPAPPMPTTPTAPTTSAPTPAAGGAGGLQGGAGGAAGGQAAGAGGGGGGVATTASFEGRVLDAAGMAPPPKGAPSLWLTAEMSLPSPDPIWAGESVDDDPTAYGSPSPGGASSSSGTVI